MQNWEDVRLENCYYVDKTRFIAEIEASNKYLEFCTVKLTMND